MPQSVVRLAGGVIITTYEALKIHQDLMLAVDWAYAILDEGHKIKNPDAEITLVAKRLRVCFWLSRIRRNRHLLSVSRLYVTMIMLDATPDHPVRVAHPKQSHRAVVTLRLCLSRQTGRTQGASGRHASVLRLLSHW